MKLVNFRNIPIVELTLRLLPDKLYIKLLYRKNFGKWPDLKHPRSFTEKLQWLKLYYRVPEYSIMVDKLLVKSYVANIIGEEHIIPTLFSWESVDDIQKDKLPNQFVLKWNHDSGSIVICKDKSKFDFNGAKNKLKVGQRRNGFWYGREWPYKNVKPMLIAEKFIVPKNNFSFSDLMDYKFFCFNGKVKFFKVDFGRFVDHRANYYSPKGELLPFGEIVCPPNPEADISLPTSFSTMIEFAEKLAIGMPFVRVDFYDVDGHVYFGEITFYPGSGFAPYTSSIWDNRIGDLLKLPK